MEKDSGDTLSGMLQHMSPVNRFFVLVLFCCFVITFPIVITVIDPFALSEKAMARGLVLFLCLLGSLIFYFMTLKRVAWLAIKNNKAQRFMYLPAFAYIIVFGIYAYVTVLMGDTEIFHFKTSLLHLVASGIICAIVMNRARAISSTTD